MLKKADSEPWPCEFQEGDHSKWVADELVPWTESKIKPTEDNPCFNSLETHINSQFNLCLLANPSLIEKSPLNVVRDVVKVLFDFSSPCFRIQYKDSPWEKAEWHIRVHRPVLISPLGTPMLMVSALDNRLVEKLMGEGKWDPCKFRKDFSKIFPDYSADTAMTCDFETEEEMRLLRFVLRLNSTRIVPTMLQKKCVTMDEDSPWLATFVTPLYLDVPLNQQEVPEDSDSESSIDDSVCTVCRKNEEKLKCCSRCRSAFYCSVKCQRTHWPKHKKFCKK